MSVVDIDALLEGAHDLEEGDVVCSVDGVMEDPDTSDVVTHIKLRHRAGVGMELGVLRGGRRIALSLQTKRQSFRKHES